MKGKWVVQDGVYTLRVAPLPPGLGTLEFRGRRVRGGAKPPSQDMVRLEQVHGIQVSWASQPGVLPASDAVRSTKEELPLTVRTADCLSVVLASPHDGAAVIHAGWRGLAGGIVEATVATFPTPDRLHAVLGPAIGGCCFEVGPEVAERFPESLILPPRRKKTHVDLPAEAVRRLVHAGVPANAVTNTGFCTKCNQHLLYSHRGSGGDGNRCLTMARYRPV